MDPLRHVKPVVRQIRAYTLAAREAPVKINQNENPWDLPEAVKRRVLEKALVRPWSRYPDFDPRELTEALAGFAGWRPAGRVLAFSPPGRRSVDPSLFQSGFERPQKVGGGSVWRETI